MMRDCGRRGRQAPGPPGVSGPVAALTMIVTPLPIAQLYAAGLNVEGLAWKSPLDIMFHMQYCLCPLLGQLSLALPRHLLILRE